MFSRLHWYANDARDRTSCGFGPPHPTRCNWSDFAQQPARVACPFRGNAGQLSARHSMTTSATPCGLRLGQPILRIGQPLSIRSRGPAAKANLSKRHRSSLCLATTYTLSRSDLSGAMAFLGHIPFDHTDRAVCLYIIPVYCLSTYCLLHGTLRSRLPAS